MDKEEIRRRYDRFARWYDLVESIPELLGVRPLRRALAGRATGRVLEVACGTGKNFSAYPDSVDLLAVDLSREMLEVARARANRLGRDVRCVVMDGERLGFPDASFDTVVSSLTLCTFPDPVGALREMARVCRSGGRILLLEHGRSNREWLGRWQDRRTTRHARLLGCRFNQDPPGLVRQAGLPVVASRRRLFGILHLIEAARR